MMSCHKCQIFQGKRKLLLLPFQPISIQAPFQQWGLDFIGEIHPSSSAQQNWISTTTYYFTKWIEEIPTRKAADLLIIQLMESNILSKFGCPQKIITDNAAAFKSKNMVEFFEKYSIKSSHSTSYYSQGNGLAESSNKTLFNIIEIML